MLSLAERVASLEADAFAGADVPFEAVIGTGVLTISDEVYGVICLLRTSQKEINWAIESTTAEQLG
jgi:hypothetical protein